VAGVLTDAPVAPWLEGFRPSDLTSVSRTEVVRPAMCGHNSLLVGQIGDWTWDAVSALCGTDVLRATTAAGEPAYLSFAYYRVRGSRRFHLRTPTFGDRLHVTSQLFDCGSEAVLTLHRIARSPAGAAAPAGAHVRGFGPEEFYAFADDDCLYVENFNRWISRPDDRSNRVLVPASPPDFRHRHLPAVPDAFSPRHACRLARTHLTFLDGEDARRYRPVGPSVRAAYTVDPARDLNGVGLLYFATYFSIVDWAVLQLWRALGRSDRSFLERVAVDQQLCYLGNADAGCVVDAAVQRRVSSRDSSHEVVDVVLRDREGARPLAVSTLRVLRPA
jgi:probable biosynthetic protein (TIGR04098 family)